MRNVGVSLATLAAIAAVSVGIVHAVTGSDALAAIAFRFFDETCDYSHSGPNDPLKFHDQPGASHEHDFFGNHSTDAFSTGDSLMAANSDGTGTSCHDTKDGSGYWTPTLYQDGAALHPFQIHSYYSSNADLSLQRVQTFPVGFGEISHDYQWSCNGSLERFTEVPVCANGHLNLSVGFKECWDGVNLFKADQSHVAGKLKVHGPCPASHPVLLPRVGVNFMYRVDGQPHTYELALSPGVNGPTTTAHADLFEAQDAAALQGLVDRCLNTYEKHVDGCNRN